MPYSADIDALNPVHAFSFNGDATDRIGALGSTNNGAVFTGPGLCEGVTNSFVTNGILSNLTTAASATFSNVDQPRLAIAGWISLTAIQNPPKHALMVGGLTNSIRILVGWGNVLMFEAFATGLYTLQIFGDTVLEVNRPYHLCVVFEGNGFGNEFRCYLDGVPQLKAEPLNRQPDSPNLPSRGNNICFGVDSSASAVGGTQVDTLSLINGQYNEWAFFDGANAVLTDTEIREELFEKGALPDNTITNQAGLDALAATVRPNAPVCIRVDVAGSLTLTADNVTFNALASVHVQYMGTGTLTWINNNGSDASIGSTPNGGTINFVTPATLTVNGLVAGSEIRIYEAGTTTELAGVESSGTSFSTSLQAANVDVRILALGYQNKAIKNVSMASDVTLIAGQLTDRQYENP